MEEQVKALSVSPLTISGIRPVIERFQHEIFDGDHAETIRDICVKSSRSLLSLTSFDPELGFTPTEASKLDMVTDLLTESRSFCLEFLAVNPGKLGLIHIHKPEAVEGTEDSWLVLPFGYVHREDYGVLYGVFVGMKDNLKGYVVYYGELIIRNHVITGVA